MKNGKIKRRLSAFIMERKGATAVIVALLLLVFLGITALAIDIGHMMMLKGELQNAADAAALTGARGLWPANLTSISDPDIRSKYPKWEQGEALAKAAAASNRVEGISLDPNGGEVTAQAGVWNYTAKTFSPEHSSNTNSVRVTTRRDDVQMYFAPIFNIFSKNMEASATAIMDFGVSLQASLPIVMNGKRIHYKTPLSSLYPNPATTDNMGWFALSEDNSANTDTLRSYIPGDKDYHPLPALSIGDTIYINNGAIDALFQDLQRLIDSQPVNPDTGTQVLDCILPIVETDSFNHPTQIVDFASIRITGIKRGKDKHIEGYVLGFLSKGDLLPGEGGGGGGALSRAALVDQ
jgi:Flp pilus assembly protein TadG